MVERSDDVEIVTLRLGFDRFDAHLVTEACRAEGLTVELLTMDDHGSLPGNLAVIRHRLLVRSDELEAAQRILARSGYDPDAPWRPARSSAPGDEGEVNPLGA